MKVRAGRDSLTHEDIDKLMAHVVDAMKKAIDQGKEVNFDWSRGVKDISRDTDMVERVAPDGSMEIIIMIPKDSSGAI